jgi:hypothetical protein
MSDTDQDLDLAEASGVELAEFAQRHGVALERLQRCQEYLRASAPIRAKFKLLPLTAEPETDAVPALVLRLVRDDGAWVELPTTFPSEHLVALLDRLRED